MTNYRPLLQQDHSENGNCFGPHTMLLFFCLGGLQIGDLQPAFNHRRWRQEVNASFPNHSVTGQGQGFKTNCQTPYNYEGNSPHGWVDWLAGWKPTCILVTLCGIKSCGTCGFSKEFLRNSNARHEFYSSLAYRLIS